MESILSKVHYFPCHDYTELLATVHLLGEFIEQHPSVSLVSPAKLNISPLQSALV